MVIWGKKFPVYLVRGLTHSQIAFMHHQLFGKPGSSAENRRKSGGLVGKPQVLHHPHFCITQGFAVRVSRVALVLGPEQDSPTSRPKPRWPAELPEARVGIVCQLKRGTRLKFCPEWKNCFQTDP